MSIERTDTGATLISTETKIANAEAFVAERKDDLADW
jgi:hypothetical protein